MDSANQDKGLVPSAAYAALVTTICRCTNALRNCKQHVRRQGKIANLHASASNSSDPRDLGPTPRHKPSAGVRACSGVGNLLGVGGRVMGRKLEDVVVDAIGNI